LILTNEGELFYQKANVLLQFIRQTSSQLYDLGKQILPVKVGIPPLLSTLFYPEMLLAFKKEYPDIPIELFEYGSIRAAALVQEDELDLALVNMHFYDIDKMNSYRILADHIVLCVSPEHRFAQMEEISIEMLKDESLIMYNTDSVQNTTLSALFESIGIKPNIIMPASFIPLKSLYLKIWAEPVCIPPYCLLPQVLLKFLLFPLSHRISVLSGKRGNI